MNVSILVCRIDLEPREAVELWTALNRDRDRERPVLRDLRERLTTFLNVYAGHVGPTVTRDSDGAVEI
jgi:hypothetical protein